jgi:ribonuclease HI
MKKAVLNTDGCSLGNPGPAGIGAVLTLGNKTVELSEHIGTTTNNVAEYSAIIRGLEEARGLGAEEVAARLDSELIVKQVKGEYKVKHEGLKPLFQKLTTLINSFRKFSISHVPREENKRADKLSKEAAKGAQPRPHSPRQTAQAASKKGKREGTASESDQRRLF